MKRTTLTNILAAVFALAIMMLLTPAFAANQTQNQIYALCAATLTYEAMLESRTGEGPKYKRLITAGTKYVQLLDREFHPVVANVVAQIENGLISISDARGTATNCLRWYEDGSYKDLK